MTLARLFDIACSCQSCDRVYDASPKRDGQTAIEALEYRRSFQVCHEFSEGNGKSKSACMWSYVCHLVFWSSIVLIFTHIILVIPRYCPWWLWWHRSLLLRSWYFFFRKWCLWGKFRIIRRRDGFGSAASFPLKAFPLLPLEPASWNLLIASLYVTKRKIKLASLKSC